MSTTHTNASQATQPPVTPEVASYLKSLVLEKLRAHDFPADDALMTSALTQLSRIIHPSK